MYDIVPVTIGLNTTFFVTVLRFLGKFTILFPISLNPSPENNLLSTVILKSVSDITSSLLISSINSIFLFISSFGSSVISNWPFDIVDLVVDSLIVSLSVKPKVVVPCNTLSPNPVWIWNPVVISCCSFSRSSWVKDFDFNEVLYIIYYLLTY